MNNTQIEIFSVMVQTENIHYTAQRLGIDAAAVTTSICALENEIGFNLILRGKNISNCLEGKNYGATWWYDSSHSSFFL
ncbi:helix-turn-helix domain-containing protein, partial [Klebsiella quasipneumoniae]|uniref:helix-turn-helix domain-containing protein n=1 Tax=Klebsiella quasipneumoniae TaxID=1463165 RepID=UPI0039B4F93C